MKPEVIEHLARAEELLEVAAELLAGEHPADAISRAYYATFHAAKAVLSELEIERASHHALWAAFGQYVTKAGLIDPKFHRYGLDAFSARLDSDYRATPKDTAEDAELVLDNARELAAACRQFLESR